MNMKHLSKLNSLAFALALAAVLAVGGSAAYAQHGSDDSAPETETHTSVSDKVAAIKEEHKTRTAEDKTKACESHKQGLETKFSHIATNSQRIDDRITGVLNKAIAYQQANNVTADNFDSLASAAQTAKTNADNAIAQLKTVTPSVDCNSTSVASDVAAFKTQAAATRDSLKSYRTAVKAVLKALLTAKQADKTAEGSDQ
jgi:hypothetical protein